MERDTSSGASHAAPKTKAPRVGSRVQRLVRRFLIFSVKRYVIIPQEIKPTGQRNILEWKEVYLVLNLIPVPARVGIWIARQYNPNKDKVLLEHPVMWTAKRYFQYYPELPILRVKEKIELF
jgi:hypothetical protein